MKTYLTRLRSSFQRAYCWLLGHIWEKSSE